jgi:hypothetical protein
VSDIDLVKAICVYLAREESVNKFTIDSDGKVAVDGDVRLNHFTLKTIPVYFKSANNFYCHNNELTTLIGCPEYVKREFDCSGNELTSLMGCPQVVANFDCSENKLTSLLGGPQISRWNYICKSNRLTSLEGAPKKVAHIFNCCDNPLRTLYGRPFCRRFRYDATHLASTKYDWSPGQKKAPTL